MRCPKCGGGAFNLVAATTEMPAYAMCVDCETAVFFQPVAPQVPAGHEEPGGSRYDVKQGPEPVYGQKAPKACPTCGADRIMRGQTKLSWATETRPGLFKCEQCGGETNTAGRKR